MNRPNPATFSKTAQERFKEKRRIILEFLREETWTRADVLEELLGVTRQAVNNSLRRMEADGLVKRIEIPVFERAPYSICGISEHGLNYAFPLGQPIEYRPTFEPSKVKRITMDHRLDLQRARIRAEKAGWTEWVAGHLIGKRLAGKKVPDAVAVDLNGRRVAIEIERTSKGPKRYGPICIAHLLSKKAGHWDRILYLCPDEYKQPGSGVELAARIERAFKTVRNPKFNGQVYKLGPEHYAPFSFLSLDEQEWLS